MFIPTLCAEWFYRNFPNLKHVDTSIEAFHQVANRTKALGFDGIELVAPLLGPDPLLIPKGTRQEMKAFLEDTDLKMAGFHWAMMGATLPVHLTDPNRVENNATWLAGIAELCRDLGGGIVVVGSPNQRNLSAQLDITYPAAFDAAAASLRKAAERVGPGVTFAVEQLAQVETDFLTTMAEAARLVDAVGSEGVKLVWDYKALLHKGLTPPQASLAIGRYSTRIVHVHLNDADRGGPRPDGSSLFPVLTALKEIGYEGFGSIEVFNGQTVPLEETARIGLDYINSVARQIDY
jgi:sugar phosphate isomerase/epimerase